MSNHLTQPFDWGMGSGGAVDSAFSFSPTVEWGIVGVVVVIALFGLFYLSLKGETNAT